MKNSNRDLLVLVKDAYTDKEAMQHELHQLNLLLVNFETLESFCIAHEVFDVQKYRILTKKSQLQKIIEQETLKPFVFICNKN
jgi:vancomycin permeability regulator SanA